MDKEQNSSITAYKGFDKNLKCRDYQFQIGETFEHKDEVKACESAKASEGSAIVCVYRDNEFRLVHIKAAIAGQEGIKADTFYTLNSDGEFVEVPA